MTTTRHAFAALLAGAALSLSACGSDRDMDLRNLFSNPADTSAAARVAVFSRPAPDERGIITYPSYRVAVAGQSDTLATLAARLGADAESLGRLNGLSPEDLLRPGELVALPEDFTPAPQAAAEVDIQEMVEGAIATADAGASPFPAPSPGGIEPARHRVAPGETAYSIARAYGISVQRLAEWNALDAGYALREGQHLLIPAVSGEPRSDSTAALDFTKPGVGTPTPQPPSAAEPLPEADATVSEPVEAPNFAPDLGKTLPPSDAPMDLPVRGIVIREYVKGENDGLDLAAEAGEPVRAAAAGTVGAVTTDSDGITIIVIRHPSDMLTIYSNVANVAVAKGDAVERGGKIAEVPTDGPAAIHFQVREGLDSVNPMDYVR